MVIESLQNFSSSFPKLVHVVMYHKDLKEAGLNWILN